MWVLLVNIRRIADNHRKLLPGQRTKPVALQNADIFDRQMLGITLCQSDSIGHTIYSGNFAVRALASQRKRNRPGTHCKESRIRQGCSGNRASACSTRHSVSGRGIKVAGETKITATTRILAPRLNEQWVHHRDDVSVAHQVADIVRQSLRFTKGEDKSTPFAGNMFQQDFSITPRAFARLKLAYCFT